MLEFVFHRQAVDAYFLRRMISSLARSGTGVLSYVNLRFRDAGASRGKVLMNEDTFRRLCRHVQALTSHDDSHAEAFLAGAIARTCANGDTESFAFGRRHPSDERAAELPSDAIVRVASVSKMATARAVVELFSPSGSEPATPVRDVLKWFPQDKEHGSITLAHLLSHTSGLSDKCGYIVAPPDSLPEFVERTGCCPVTSPGSFFRYANLNYVLLGAIVEVLSGERFDRAVAKSVLDPAGVVGGFNWAGTGPDERRKSLPLYQRYGKNYVLEADSPRSNWAAPLIWRDGIGVELTSYRLGEDTGLFSPHAGLRTDVVGLARLVQFSLEDSDNARLQRQIVWQLDEERSNGAHCDGLFRQFGLGLSLHEADARIGKTLIGHAGHALGFTGGAWGSPETGDALGYFLTGSADLTDGSDDESIYPAEELEFLRAF